MGGVGRGRRGGGIFRRNTELGMKTFRFLDKAEMKSSLTVTLDSCNMKIYLNFHIRNHTYFPTV